MSTQPFLCRTRLVLLLSASVAATLLAFAPVSARGVRAGTVIDNSATATFSEGGQSATITSNTVSLKVDEVLDVAVAAQDSGDLPVGAGKVGAVRGFTVTNAGNGQEAFVLNALAETGSGFAPAITGLAIDTNGNGVYDPGFDQLVTNGATSVALAPDASLTVFVVSDIPQAATDAQRGGVRLNATAATGSGTPGTAFAGKGDGGADAVVGATTASARDRSGFLVQRATVAFTKSATVADPFGGSRALPGSVITYRLVASITGNGTATDLAVADGIPAGTTYQPGTLALDGTALTDADDADAGHAGSQGIAVRLGNVAAGTNRTVTFQVKID